DKVTVQNGSLTFQDTFAAGSPAGDPSDGSQLSRQWTDQLGNINVNSSNQAVGTSDFNLSTVNGITQADVKVLAGVNLTLGSGQSAGIVARYGGPGYSNFYLAQVRDVGTGFQGAIFKNVGGTFFTVAVGSTVGSGTGTLEFEAVGSSLKLILDGKL